MGWVDVESTGLDTENDVLLEVGVIITDDDLTEIDRYSLTIWHPHRVLHRSCDNFVRNMHIHSGLWSLVQSDNSTTLFNANKFFTRWMERYPDLPMCGSSVHFDRAMLRRWMPEFEARFHYRNVDVSTLKELAYRWWPSMYDSRPTDRKIHRVIPDIEDSIAELHHYRKSLGVVAF